jgi:NTP pyrophosphatase (non-canonical NTP hydrolase)
MKFEEYLTKTERTRSKLNDNLLDNIHMSLGMVTETGELSDCFKKNLAYNKPLDWIHIQEELGDLLWYISGFCNINGLNIENILDINIKKLTARYPDRFTSENAINRNLDKEREILETLNK